MSPARVEVAAPETVSCEPIVRLLENDPDAPEKTPEKVPVVPENEELVIATPSREDISSKERLTEL